MARIDHSNCNHGATPAARKLCRSFRAAAAAQAAPVIETNYITNFINGQVAASKITRGMDRRNELGCTIEVQHCENCGATDRESLGFGGYTSCCNELVAHSNQDCRNHHA